MTEYNDEDEIKCPYCGYEEGDSWEVNNSDDDYECSDCGKRFILEIEHQTTYSTKRKICEDDKHELEEKPKFAMIFDDKWDIKTDKRNPLPKEKWEYVEYYHCKNCDEEERVVITEDEFKKKYPYNYQNTLEHHNLDVNSEKGDKK